ncbi:venom carboxylesterase-6 [Anoplophora glabripennis]|uniref:venom carboxylesterase-6 n=1 Tax=Anoplophora glabripennis TaxID=217634 RepID=UPI0008751BA1|nr:venom carboxylesterase-6 [Anoplophora glabripennis]
MSLVAIISTILALLNVANSEVVVELANGQIRGRIETTYNNVTFYAFQEIPFAKPPLGDLRFMAPQPVDDWEGILDCTKETKICRQISKNDPMENEDCLYVNVYSPVKPGTDPVLPVMYNIYGGGFNHGSNRFADSGPHYFMEQGVIIVTVNYRTGPLGFLSTEDAVIPGNNGLRDQNFGLQWIQNNIHLFGGDPKKVTIFGQSAGGASVTYQILSKQSKGLFRAAIAQSGSALNPWTYQRHAKNIAYQFAAQFDPTFTTNQTSQELLELLQNVPEDQLAEVSSSFSPEGISSEQIIQGYYWAPVIEPTHQQAFLTDRQYGILESGDFNKVPLIIGICSEESLQRALDQESFQKNVANYEKDIQNLVNEDLHLTNEVALTRVGEQIRKIYTDGELSSNLSSAVRFYSDTSFTRAIRRYAEIQSQFTDVYFYQFSYFGEMSRFTEIDLPGAGKVPHVGDNHYLWTINNNSNVHIYPVADALTSRRYVKLFTDFSKYLNPTPEETSLMQNLIWPKVNSSSFLYLDIDENLEVKLNPKNESYTGWVDVYDTWAVKPYDTY